MILKTGQPTFMAVTNVANAAIQNYDLLALNRLLKLRFDEHRNFRMRQPRGAYSSNASTGNGRLTHGRS
jgi:hypothetical protein